MYDILPRSSYDEVFTRILQKNIVQKTEMRKYIILNSIYQEVLFSQW